MNEILTHNPLFVSGVEPANEENILAEHDGSHSSYESHIKDSYPGEVELEAKKVPETLTGLEMEVPQNNLRNGASPDFLGLSPSDNLPFKQEPTEMNYNNYDNTDVQKLENHTQPTSIDPKIVSPILPTGDVMSPLQTLQKLMHTHQVIFKEQLKECHRLVGIHKILTGVEPITGQLVWGPEAPIIPDAARTMLNINEKAAAVSQALESNPNPTREFLQQLGYRLGLSEQQIANFWQIRSAQLQSLGQSPNKDTKQSKQTEKEKAKTETSIKLKDLETKLTNLLDNNGGISKQEDVVKVIQLMSEETNSEGRSLLLSVILETKKNECKKKFITSDGLNVLNKWLLQYKTKEKVNMLRIILKVLYSLPITVSSLKTSQIGKSVKKLVSFKNKKVSAPASRLFKSWTQLVTDATGKSKEKQTGIETNKTKVENAASTSRSNLKRTRDESIDFEKNLDAGNKKIKSNASSSVPVLKGTSTSTVKQTSVNVASDFDAMLAASSKPKIKRTEPKRGFHLVPEHVKRRKHTVQLLELGQTDAKDEKDGIHDKKSSSSYESKPMSADEIKKRKFQEKVGKTDVSGSDKDKKVGLSKVNRPLSNVSLAANKARTAAAASRSSATKTSTTTSVLTKRKREEGNDDQDFGIEDTNSPKNSPTHNSNDDAQKEETKDGKETSPPKKAKTKKRVTWAVTLREVRTYEKYLPSMNRMFNFQEAMEREKMREREFAEEQKKKWRERLENTRPSIAWRRPPPLFNPEGKDIIIESKELLIQNEREKRVLAETYAEGMIPPNPAEVEHIPEDYDDANIPEIPWEPIRNNAGSSPPQLPLDLGSLSMSLGPALGLYLGAPAGNFPSPIPGIAGLAGLPPAFGMPAPVGPPISSGPPAAPVAGLDAQALSSLFGLLNPGGPPPNIGGGGIPSAPMNSGASVLNAPSSPMRGPPPPQQNRIPSTSPAQPNMYDYSRGLQPPQNIPQNQPPQRRPMPQQQQQPQQPPQQQAPDVNMMRRQPEQQNQRAPPDQGMMGRPPPQSHPMGHINPAYNPDQPTDLMHPLGSQGYGAMGFGMQHPQFLQAQSQEEYNMMMMQQQAQQSPGGQNHLPFKESTQSCHFFNSSMGCRYGATCKFQHVQSNEGVDMGRSNGRESRGRDGNRDRDRRDRDRGSSGGSSRRRSRR